MESERDTSKDIPLSEPVKSKPKPFKMEPLSKPKSVISKISQNNKLKTKANTFDMEPVNRLSLLSKMRHRRKDKLAKWENNPRLVVEHEREES